MSSPLADRRLCQVSAATAFIVLVAGQSSLGSGAARIPAALLGVPALLAALLGPVVLRLRQTRKSPVLTSVFWSVSVLLVVLAASAMWANGEAATTDELLWIVLLIGLLAVVSATAQLDPRATVDTFMLLSVIFGIVFAAAGLLDSAGSSRISAFGGGPNVFGRITGIGVVAVMYWVLRGYRGWPILIAFVPLLATATLLSGSRGAMLGSLVGLMVVALGFNRRTLRRLIPLAIVMVPVVLIVYSVFGRHLQSVVTQRIVKLTFEEGYTAGRNTLWAAAGDLIQTDPILGSGLGTYINQNGFYAHNLILQVGVDSGLLGIAVLFGCLIVIVKNLMGRPLRSPLVLAPVAAALVIFVASMFSGDYYDSRFFWAFSIVACAMATQLRTQPTRAPGSSGVGRGPAQSASVPVTARNGGPASP